MTTIAGMVSGAMWNSRGPGLPGSSAVHEVALIEGVDALLFKLGDLLHCG
jgi:hypothetical protein